MILSDMVMPGMNGIDILKKVKAFNRDIPFIIISAYDKKTYINQAFKSGVYRYLVKPLNPLELIGLIDETLKT